MTMDAFCIPNAYSANLAAKRTFRDIVRRRLSRGSAATRISTRATNCCSICCSTRTRILASRARNPHCSIASHYTLQADGDSAGELRPKRGLKAALAFWDDAFPGIAYSPLQDDASGDISGRCRPRGWRCWTSIRSYGMHLRYSMGWCVPQWHFR